MGNGYRRLWNRANWHNRVSCPNVRSPRSREWRSPSSIFLGEQVTAVQSKFAKRVSKWLADDYSRLERWHRGLSGIFYNRMPRRFSLLPVTHWLIKTGLASSAPLIAFYYGSIGMNTAYYAASALFATNIVLNFLGLFLEKKNYEDPEALVRFGDLLTSFKVNSVAKQKRDDAIRACLGILEVHTRRITKSDKGEIAVSLVQYVGSSSSLMTIRHRNPGNNRAVGREFDGTDLLGHHACQGVPLPRVVHHTRFFGSLNSPTQSGANYKSLMFIPLEVAGPKGENRVKGFVSIDCQRPYGFYGNRSREIMVTCRPIVDHIRDLLRENG